MNFKSLFKRSKPVSQNSINGLGVRSSSKSSTPIINYTQSTFGGGAKSYQGISGDGIAQSVQNKRMVINARNAYRESLEARAIVDRNVDIVTDTGIKIDPTCNASLLGISDDEADKWNDDIGERFDLFMSSKTCNRSRMWDGYEATQLYNKALLTDNNQFVRFYFEKESDSLSTVSFEFVDPMCIGGDGVTSTDGTVNLFDGIERDSKGREIAYRVRVRNKNGAISFVRIPARSRDKKRVMMVHGFIPDQIGQLQGTSSYGHVIQEFQNMTDFKLAHIDKAIQQASMAIAIENTGENDPSDPFEDMSTPAGPAGTIPYGINQPSGETPVDDAMNINRIDEFTTGARGSLAIVNLRAKDKVHSISNTAPVTNYDKFVEAFTSHMAASVRMPVEVLLMKFSSNYSASRAALILFYRVAQIYRKKIDSNFLTPLYENWLSEEIASGRVVAPGWSDPILRAAWCKHSLISAPVPNIDPAKTAKANKDNIAIGATTYDRAAQETNGSNGKANRAANRRQAKELESPYWESDMNNASIGGETENDAILNCIVSRLDDMEDSMSQLEVL